MKNKSLKIIITLIITLIIVSCVEINVFADAIAVPDDPYISTNETENTSIIGTNTLIGNQTSVDNKEKNSNKEKKSKEDKEEDNKYMLVGMGVVGGLVLVNLLFSIVVLTKVGKK